MTRKFEEMYPTLAVFEAHARGILNIIKAADIYALHIKAAYHNTEVDKELISKILKSDAISPLAFDGWSYQKNELAALEETGHMKNIGQQIIVATYTALEVYLIEKFKEYYRFLLKDRDTDIIENSLKRFSFRSLEEIKKHYKDILKIHLPSFNITYYRTPKCNWRPKDCWDAIITLGEARNQIAHAGSTKDYKLVTLMDAWFPFEFVCDWVRSFDVDFDNLIYRGKESAAIKDYKELLAKEKLP